MESPWEWQPSRDSWYSVIKAKASDLNCRVAGLDSSTIQSAIRSAAGTKSDWLWHPCLSVLCGSSPPRNAAEIRLATWVAANTEFTAGLIKLDSSLIVWMPSGAFELQAGDHELSKSGIAPVAEFDNNHFDIEPSLDLWCHSTGMIEPHSWAESPPSHEGDEDVLNNQILTYIRTVICMREMLPACMSWVKRVARVVVPLRGGNDVFRSCSHPSIPGMIALDLGSIADIAESLVHESAHLHLFTAEAENDLVFPDHDGRYPSPLQPLPRPLRGILLAYHALAYICALYRDAADVPAFSPWAGRLMLNRELAFDAERVLLEQQHHLTAAGREFLFSTKRVVEYATSQ